MMELVRLSLRRPYTIATCAALTLLLGVLSIQRMAVDFFPRINIPVVFVAWEYLGLPTEEMERRIVSIAERIYSTSVTGIERLESRSIPGIGLIKVSFQEGTHIGASIAQINAANSTILTVLPPGTQPPVLLQYDAATVPIVQMIFSSKSVPEVALFDHAFNFVRPKLFSVPGLAVPAPFGGRARRVNVDIDPQALQAKGVSAFDVVSALQSSNVMAPAGSARIGSIDYNITTNASPRVLEQFKDMPIKVVDGVPVSLGDVAKVEDGFFTQTNVVHVNGQRATYLTVLKKSDASSLDVVNATRRLLPEIRAGAPEGVAIELDFDQSVYVRSAVRSVVTEAVAAGLLVSLMVMLFLGSWRSTTIIVTSIPLAIIAGILGLYFTGHSINLMTLGGLSLATGLLVDDATVAVENIHRHRLLGRSLLGAIIEGSREVALPRTMATLAIVVVFIPVAFLYGVSKYLFVPLALAVVFSLLASYVLSFTLVPLLAARMLRNQAETHAETGWLARCNRRREQAIEALRDRYVLILGVLLRHRAFTLACLVLLVGSGVVLGRAVGTDFFPTSDVGIIKLHFRAPIGTRIEETERMVLRLGDEIRKVIPAEQLGTINDMIGVPRIFNLAFVPTDNISGMDADILISLKGKRRPVSYYQEQIRRRIFPLFPGASLYFQSADMVTQVLNFGLSAPIDVQMQDGNFERAQRYAGRLRSELERIPGVIDVRQVQVLDYPAMHVAVDRQRAARLGLTARDVTNSLLTSLSSSYNIAPSFYLAPNGVSYPVTVQASLERMQSVDDLLSTPLTASTLLRSESGASLVPTSTSPPPPSRLSNVATLMPVNTYQSVSHDAVQRVVNLAANIDGRDLGSVGADIQRVIDRITAEPDFPASAKIVLRGQYEVMHASFVRLLGGLLLAVVLVYALLVVLYQSWIDPLIIMSAVPGALLGIIWALALTGTSINVMSMMGAIMAVGIGVANSILVVTFANEARTAQPGMTVFEAAVEAGKTRMRPVLMTAMAMIIGMVPMAIGGAVGGEQNAPLARAVIGGLTLATVSTLFIVPLIYTLLRRSRPVMAELDAQFEQETQRLATPGG